MVGSRFGFFWIVSLAAIGAFWYFHLTPESFEPFCVALAVGRCLQLVMARRYGADAMVLFLSGDFAMVLAAYLGLYELQGTAPGLVVLSLGSFVVGVAEVRAFRAQRGWLWISSVVTAHLLAVLAEREVLSMANSSENPIQWRSARYLIFAAVAALVRASSATWLMAFQARSAAVVCMPAESKAPHR